MNDLNGILAPAYHRRLHRRRDSRRDDRRRDGAAADPIRVFAASAAQRGQYPGGAAAAGRGAGRFALPLIAALIAIPYLTFPEALGTLLVRLTAIASIVAVAWAIIASIGLYTDMVKRRYSLEDEDNLHARETETRINILSRTAVILVVFVAFAFVGDDLSSHPRGRRHVAG